MGILPICESDFLSAPSVSAAINLSINLIIYINLTAAVKKQTFLSSAAQFVSYINIISLSFA